jgi:DNA-binding GntR family transcriptional regulator
VAYVPRIPVELIADELRAELTPLPSGTRVLSVRVLAERFGVSPRTIQKALAILRAEGLIVSRHGYGTFRA